MGAGPLPGTQQWMLSAEAHDGAAAEGVEDGCVMRRVLVTMVTTSSPGTRTSPRRFYAQLRVGGAHGCCRVRPKNDTEPTLIQPSIHASLFRISIV